MILRRYGAALTIRPAGMCPGRTPRHPRTLRGPMRVYHPSEAAERQRIHLMHVAPGAHVARGDGPADWWDSEGRPVTFPVAYAYGRAEVDDALGRLMIAHGYAKATALILPTEDFLLAA